MSSTQLGATFGELPLQRAAPHNGGPHSGDLRCFPEGRRSRAVQRLGWSLAQLHPISLSCILRMSLRAALSAKT